MDCRTTDLPVPHYLPEFAQYHGYWINDAIKPSYSLPPSSPFAFCLFQHQGLFRWPGSSHRVTKILELQLQYQSFQWVFKVDFLRIDWFDLLAVQETLRRLIQHHNSKASSCRCSAFFMVQLTLLFVTTGKTTALTIWTFVSKVMSLLLNNPSRLFSVTYTKVKTEVLGQRASLSLFPGKPLVSELYCIRITAPISCFSFEDLHCIS